MFAARCFVHSLLFESPVAGEVRSERGSVLLPGPSARSARLRGPPLPSASVPWTSAGEGGTTAQGTESDQEPKSKVPRGASRSWLCPCLSASTASDQFQGVR